MAFNPVKEDVAKDGMINVEDATTHIKELVIKSLNAGETKEQILSDVKRIIAKCIKGIEAIHDKETVMKSLWSLANQVLYEYTRAVQVFTLNAYNKAVDLGFMNDTYSYSFGDSKKIVDNFRNMIDSEKKDMIFPIIEDYQKKLRDTIRVLSAESPIAVEKTPTGATRKLGLRARAELQIRYEANMQELERYKTEGAKLVWITSHPNCSPRCAKYQGRLYSLDGTTGKIDGHSYEPIEVALAGPYGDGNGCISGYNCRHRLIEYKSGSKPPIEYTEAEIKRAYGIDREQRAYENEIRQMKVEERLLRAHGDTEAAKILRKKWRILTKKYEIFCLENKRPMTTWRCVVSKEEMEDINKNLTPEDKSAKIESAVDKAFKTEMPYQNNAYIAEDKVPGYLLNPNHENGKSKAKFLNVTLGYTTDHSDPKFEQDCEMLRNEIMRAFKENKKVFETVTDQGHKYKVSAKITGPNGKTANMDFYWMLLFDTTTPHLVTAIPGKKDKE